jgi:hypothetical protein
MWHGSDHVFASTDASSGWFEQTPGGAASDVSAWYQGEPRSSANEDVGVLGVWSAAVNGSLACLPRDPDHPNFVATATFRSMSSSAGGMADEPLFRCACEVPGACLQLDATLAWYLHTGAHLARCTVLSVQS